MKIDREKIKDEKNRTQKAGGLIISNGKVLLVSIDDINYSLPKGHIEKNESLEEGALREVYEETGINCEIIKKLPNIYYSYEDSGEPVVLHIFLMRPETDVINTKEKNIVKWFDYNEAINKFTYQNLAEYLVKMKNEIN